MISAKLAYFLGILADVSPVFQAKRFALFYVKLVKLPRKMIATLI
jgi:hypothetical protein